MENNTKTPLFKSRRFKYGSMAIGLTVLLIALVIALNAVVYAITYTNGWYIDLSGQQYYGITDDSTLELKNALTEDVEIQITFCQDRDKVLSDSAGYYVYKCVESYKKEYPNNIKMSFVDIVKNPDIAKEYKDSHTETITPGSVIIESNTKWSSEKDKSYVYDSVRVLTYNDFFMFDADTGDVWAFKGELVLTSSIVALCEGMPICYFTTGNGETISTTTESGSTYEAEIVNLMRDAGFEVRTIDLDKTPDLSDAKVVIVNDPKMDFTQNEVDLLDQYMNDKNGNLMIFLSPEAMIQTEGNKLTNIETFLDNWGIEIVGGPVVDDTNSVPSSDEMINPVVADYPLTNIGSALHANLREFVGSVPMTVINNPLAFETTWRSDGNGGYTGGASNALYWTLHSYSTASLGDQSNEMYNLAALIEKTRVEPVTNSDMRTYMLVTSTGFVAENYLSSNAYGNRDILFQLTSGVMAKEQVVRDIDFVIFAYEDLTITTGEAYTWTVLLVAVIPAIVLVAGGTVCFIRRKRG